MTKTKKITISIIAIILLSILIVLVFFTQIQIAPIVPTTPIIPTSTETSIPTITPNPLQNPEQIVTINWGSVTPPPVTKLSIYSITTPLVNESKINTLPGLIGFSPKDSKKSYTQNSRLWETQGSFLFISPDEKTISFHYAGTPSASVKPNMQQVSAAAQQIMNRLFSDTVTTFRISGTPSPLRYSGLYYTTPSTLADAELIEINIEQTINNLPLVIDSGNARTIQMFLLPSLELLGLEVKGGYSTIATINEIDTLDFETLKIIAPQKIQRVTAQEETLSDYASILSAGRATIDVNSIKLAYYQTTNNLLIPYFLISGTITADDKKEPGDFLVPATRN